LTLNARESVAAPGGGYSSLGDPPVRSAA